jgi:hypothetical protein
MSEWTGYQWQQGKGQFVLPGRPTAQLFADLTATPQDKRIIA